MDDDPFIDDFPVKTAIYEGFSIAMANNQTVDILCNDWGHSIGLDT